MHALYMLSAAHWHTLGGQHPKQLLQASQQHQWMLRVPHQDNTPMTSVAKPNTLSVLCASFPLQ